jgi:hypothetical protein
VVIASGDEWRLCASMPTLLPSFLHGLSHTSMWHLPMSGADWLVGALSLSFHGQDNLARRLLF